MIMVQRLAKKRVTVQDRTKTHCYITDQTDFLLRQECKNWSKTESL